VVCYATTRYQNHFRKGVRGKSIEEALMAKKTCVDRAAESGDWMSAEKKAASALRKSGARLRQARAARAEPEVIGRFEGLTPDAPEPADTSEDDVQEYKNDGPAPEDEPDFLPDDAQEKALAPPPEPAPLVRSPRRVAAEQARRVAQAEQRALEQHFELRRLVAERPKRVRVEAERQKYRKRADDRERYDWAEIEAHAVVEGSCIECRHDAPPSISILEIRNGQARLVRAMPEGFKRSFERINRFDKSVQPWVPHGETLFWLDDSRWTRLSKLKPPGPPRDPPPERDSGWRPPSRGDLWKHRHRGFMTSFAGARDPGRPRKENKLTRAEIQKAYRDRQRARNPK
jgi:hypothetical protein